MENGSMVMGIGPHLPDDFFDLRDLPAFIGPKIPGKWRALGSLLRCFERTALA
jgi:hypothetical protein